MLAVGETVTVAGTYEDCVQTEDTTPLEPDVLEYKYHCAGIGTVLEVNPADEERIGLVSIAQP